MKNVAIEDMGWSRGLNAGVAESSPGALVSAPRRPQNLRAAGRAHPQLLTADGERRDACSRVYAGADRQAGALDCATRLAGLRAEGHQSLEGLIGVGNRTDTHPKGPALRLLGARSAARPRNSQGMRTVRPLDSRVPLRSPYAMRHADLTVSSGAHFIRAPVSRAQSRLVANQLNLSDEPRSLDPAAERIPLPSARFPLS
jgi:hypothetical protein